MDKYFKDNKLKNLLNGNLGYYADDPYQLSWFYHATTQASYFNKDIFIKGDSQVLSNQLTDIIKQHRGEVRYPK
ncbi:MAG: hypothetical protein ACRCV0_01630 [Brevinema sp.]